MPRIWNTPRRLVLGSLFVAFAGMALAITAHPSQPAWAADLTMAEFQDLHQRLQVASDTPWRTIPWKTSMLDAQQTAARQAKPIFIWAMDGHPLGCT